METTRDVLYEFQAIAVFKYLEVRPSALFIENQHTVTLVKDQHRNKKGRHLMLLILLKISE